MKVLKLSWMGLLALLCVVVFYACKKDVSNSPDVTSASKFAVPGDCTGYTITLETKNSLNAEYPGTGFNYNEYDEVSTFVWTVTNAKGTQALSHWAFQWMECVNPEDILYVAAIDANGNEVEYAHAPKVDPSQSCNTKPVVKFDMGNDNGRTKYIVIMEGNYTFKAGQIGYVKSGAKTGCCTFTFDGIDCIADYCTLSQGYFFAKPGPTWPAPGTVTVGGHTYTEAEGRAIWNSSNKGGKSAAKAGFHQVAAVYLSQRLPNISPFTDAELLANVKIVEDYLKELPKLTPINVGSFRDQSVKEAAGFIGDWIEKNHCKAL